MYVNECESFEEMVPLIESWMSEAKPEAFGIAVDVNCIKEDMVRWLTGEGAILTARDDDGTVIGMLALFAVPSYLGGQKFAVEKYWYSMNGMHFAGPRLYMEAVNWAREHGCSHLITSGSQMASEAHDSICRFLEHTGAKHFETSYIYDLSKEGE